MRRSDRKRLISLLAGLFMVSLTMTSLAMGTYAWFSAEPAAIEVDSDDTATITCAAPEAAAFYYFNGNGTPGGDYSGYSRTAGSNIGTAARTYATSSSGITFSDFVHIDGTGNNTLGNCFDFSKMRPGCFYSFCVIYAATSVDLDLTFENITNGNALTPKRRIYSGGATTRPLSLAMALNGYAVASTNSDENAASFIETTFSKGAAREGSGDTINYNHASASPSLSFKFLDDANTSSNSCMYFTIYMGFNNKDDALAYNSKAVVEESSTEFEALYYAPDTRTGDYSALHGLAISLRQISVT